MITRRMRAFVAGSATLGSVGTACGQSFSLFSGEIATLQGDDRFVAPITSPYYNENSFIGSDVRLVYAHHSLNGDSILGADATATVYAAQLRLALTDRLQLVAYKDGYIDYDGSVVNSEGWNDIAAGLKWQFYRDEDSKLYAAAGAGYEFTFGESRALQNDSEVRFWGSVDKGFGKLHTGATLNYRISTSGDDRDNGNSDVLSWHMRGDYRLTDWFSPVVEVNGYHIVNDSESGVPLNGADVLNLGATGADPTISAGLGAEFRVNAWTAIRAAYEVPLASNDESLFGSRLTASMVFTF